MRLQLQKLFKSKAEIRQGIVAISFFSNGFAVVITRYSLDTRPRLVFCDFITAPQQHWHTHLEALVKTHKLEQYSCHIVLTHEQYRSFSIESPQVNPDEIKQAVHWRIAEMLDYPVDQAVIDFYHQPKSNRANREQMLEVVSCNKALLNSVLQTCHQAGLRVTVVEIQETALRNLATLLPENEQGVAILHLQPTIGHVLIEKQGGIYLSRKFDFNYRLLTESGFESDPEAQTEHSNLALEIQRSFDYVENYFDIPPINSLASVLLPSNTQGVINALMINHGITARAMDISAIVDVDIMLRDSLQNVCAPVIGASLRWYLEAGASQQVNLCQGVETSRSPVGLNPYLLTLVVSFLALLATAFVTWRSLADLQQQRLQLQRQLLIATTEVQGLQGQLPNPQGNTVLEQQLQQSQSIFQSLSQVVETLADDQDDQARGFSRYFTALADQSDSKVWLSKIEINAITHNLSLHGSTFQADLIPALLQRLQQTEAFKGRHFSHMQILQTKDAAEQVDFSVSTGQPEQDEHAAKP